VRLKAETKKITRQNGEALLQRGVRGEAACAEWSGVSRRGSCSSPFEDKLVMLKFLIR